MSENKIYQDMANQNQIYIEQLLNKYFIQFS